MKKILLAVLLTTATCFAQVDTVAIDTELKRIETEYKQNATTIENAEKEIARIKAIIYDLWADQNKLAYKANELRKQKAVKKQL